MAFNEIKLHGTEDFPLQLYCIDKNHPKYEMAHHFHTNLEIMRILKGKSAVQLNDRKYDATAGDVFFINSQVVHSAMPDESVYECIVFDPSFLSINSEFEEFINRILNHDIFIKEFSRDSEINKITALLFESLKNPKNKFAVMGNLYSLFGEFINSSVVISTHNTKATCFFKRNLDNRNSTVRIHLFMIFQHLVIVHFVNMVA